MDGMENTEWLLERAGYLTASRAEEACKRLKSGAKAASYESLMEKVICERVTGEPIVTPATPAMQWGKEHEEEAAEAVELALGQMLTGDGETFVRHPDVEWLGASPDRFLGDASLVEIKCPSTMTHLGRVMTGAIPAQYQRQMDVQLLCTGRRRCLFADYDPRLVGTEFGKAALWTQWYEPDAARLGETLALCREFLADAAERIEKFKESISISMESIHGEF